eukprot:TRINITY_DN16419_c0_g1_i1.p1 TRINITY_DN16419_c0_g1~~TRINITY_DN16419_c0_g1_i1.p1  ORF type:complete len:329 (-),score=92.47 TRINITY_DN16419_c0_g1_i1:18-983(-)
MSLGLLGIDVISGWVRPCLTVRDGVSAASTCKAMKDIEVAWIYQPRRWYLGPTCDIDLPFFKTLYQLEMNPSLHKPLPLKAFYTNGGEHSSTYSVKNITSTEKPSYCTQELQNIDVFLKLKEDKKAEGNPLYLDYDGALEDLVMLITQIDIRGSGVGYTSPLDTSVTFFLMDQPQPDQFNNYNGLDQDQFNSISLNKSIYQLQEQKLPVFFDSYHKRRENHTQSAGDTSTQNEEIPAEEMDGKAQEEPPPAPFNPRQALSHPSPVCKYIVFKMLSASGEKTNIDVSYFGVRGVLIDLKTKKQVLHREIKVTDGERRECLVM